MALRAVSGRLLSRPVGLAVRPYASAAARVTQREYLAERRRELNKSLYKPPVDPNTPIFRFPDERLGTHYELNYTLNHYGITPLGDAAYRNLHTRHLAMLVAAKADSHKALHIDAAKDDATTTILADGLDGATLSIGNWRKVMAAVTRYLSESPQLFVRDATVGAHRASQVNVRAVSSSPLADLTLSSALFPAPGNVETFYHDAVFLHAPTLTLADPSRYGLKHNGAHVVHAIIRGEQVLDSLPPQDLERISDEDQAQLATRQTVVTVLFGTTSQVALRSAVAATADLLHSLNARLTLPNAALIASTSSKSAVAVVDAASALPGSLSVLSSGGATLTKEGLSAFFGDRVTVTSTPASLAQFDLVEHLDGGKVRVTQRAPSARGAYALAPSALVLLVNDATKALPPVSRLPAPTAAALATSSLVGMPAAQQAALQSQLGDTPVYALNSALLPSDVLAAVVTAIADGTADKATVTPLKDLEGGAVTKLKGLKDAQLAHKPEKGALKAFAKSLGL